MCANGVNTGQLEQMIDMLDDYTAQCYRWSHKLAHLAEDAGSAEAGRNLHDAQDKLADVRDLLTEAKTALDAIPTAPAATATLL